MFEFTVLRLLGVPQKLWGASCWPAGFFSSSYPLPPLHLSFLLLCQNLAHGSADTPSTHLYSLRPLTSYRLLPAWSLWGLGVPTAQPGKSKVSGNCSRRGKGTRLQAGTSQYPQWSPADLEGHSWKRAQSTGPRSTGPRQGPSCPSSRAILPLQIRSIWSEA